MRRSRPLRSAQGAFTLIEMVMVIVLAGIIGTVTSSLITRPVEGYLVASQRAELVDAAEMALRTMARDIRSALPNSVRVNAGGDAIEMISAVSGGRYRRYPDAGGGGDTLDFATSSTDTSFDVIGPMLNVGLVDTSNDELAVYNITAAGTSFNAYATTLDNRWGFVTGSGGTTLGSDPVHIVVNANLDLPQGSPRQLFYVVSGPVMYRCNGTTLTRYAGYGYTTNMTVPPASGTSATLAQNVDCAQTSFSYDAGSPQRAALITMRLVLSEGDQTITLLHQVHVYNVP